MLAHRRERHRFNLKTKLRREAYCAQHSQPVFAEPLRRIADRPDALGLEVGQPTHPIVQLVGQRIIKQTVHREVPPERILSGVGEPDAAGATAVRVIGLGPEGRHLIFMPSLQHHNHAKLFADWDGFAE